MIPSIPLTSPQTSSEDAQALNKLIGAFKSIGQAMSSAELTEEAKENDETQVVLALIYDSLLEVHRRLYGLFKKHGAAEPESCSFQKLTMGGPGWRVFFETSWARFESRLHRIRQEVAQLASLLGREEMHFRIDRAQKDREQWRAELTRAEKETSAKERSNVAFWLNADELNQEDELDFISGQCHPQSCDWVYENSKIKSWMRRGAEHSVVWLKGKPGSGEHSALSSDDLVEARLLADFQLSITGKSVLCSMIIKKLQSLPDTTTVYALCTDAQTRSKSCLFLLRTLTRQLVLGKPELAAVIEAEYINLGLGVPVVQMRQLLGLLISTFPAVRIVVDGLDECKKLEQERILDVLSNLAGNIGSLSSCKVLISSQDSVTIPRKLRSRTTIDLSREKSACAAVDAAIATFVRSEISQNPLLCNSDDIGEGAISEIEQGLLTKANGQSLGQVMGNVA
jgi:hypothetical protein